MRSDDLGELLEFTQEGVGLPFLTDGGARAMPGIHTGLVRERQQPGGEATMASGSPVGNLSSQSNLGTRCLRRSKYQWP